VAMDMKMAVFCDVADCRLLVVMGRDFVSALQPVAYCTIPG
jgi:hypothetical protein